MGQMIAVVAETKRGIVRKATLEALAEARRLAGEAGGSVAAILIGAAGASEASRLAQHSADRVVQVEGAALAAYAPEAYAEAVKAAVEMLKPEALFFSATAQGKDLAPRVAARLRVGLAPDCVGFAWESGALTARRPIYAGKAFAKVAWNAARPMVASIRPNSFAPLQPDASRQAGVEAIALGDVKVRARVTGTEKSAGEMLDLTEATVIVSGGRAMQGPE
ncbi:MAG: electron transfer flavoprotein subunit alpha/FixB family protein, partial [Candidatus Eisenbacteria bacterium]